jgi:Zn-dependent protease
MLWVALAGPASNFFMALVWALIAKIALAFPENYYAVPMLEMAKIGININVVLMVLNLLPLPPLDGGRIAISMLPHRQAYQLAKIEPYGMFILIFLAVTPVLWWVLRPFMDVVYFVIRLIFGL